MGEMTEQIELEPIIDYIKESRRRGFKDDIIRKSLEKTYTKDMIDDAFGNTVRTKRAGTSAKSGSNTIKSTKTYIALILEPEEKDFLEKKAEKDNLTLYMEIKKMILDNIPHSFLPKGAFKSTMIRKKLTPEERDRNNEAVKRSRARAKRRKMKAARMRRRQERRGKRRR
jgi:hypothetical protein